MSTAVSDIAPAQQARRERLPDRREHELFQFEHEGARYTAGIGRFADGRLAEVFVNGSKVGSAAESSAQEAALAASIALQFGCPVKTLRSALTAQGRSGGPLGALLVHFGGEGQQ